MRSNRLPGEWIDEAWPGLAVSPSACGSELLLVERVSSTNDLGRRLVEGWSADRRPPAITILADGQSRGRGRGGREWVSPLGRGVYATRVQPLAAGRDRTRLPVAVSVALCRTLDHLLPVDCRIKWPNDLLAGGRKIGGILIEVLTRGAYTTALIGVGVNYSHRRKELPRADATTILRERPDAPPRGAVAGYLLSTLADQLRADWSGSRLIDTYRRLSAHAPGEELQVRRPGGEVRGTFCGFSDEGFLRLQGEGRQWILSAGEL